MFCKILKWEYKNPIIYIRPKIEVLKYMYENNFILLKIQGTDTSYDNIIMTGEIQKGMEPGVFVIYLHSNIREVVQNNGRVLFLDDNNEIEKNDLDVIF